MVMKSVRYIDIKRFAVHDGPGIRTTLFLKGCSLRCIWCHNPESRLPQPELAIHYPKCTGCGECAKFCSCHKITAGEHEFDRARCKACGRCEEVCPSEALELFGKSMTVDEAAEKLLEEVQSYGGEAFVYQADVTKPEQLKGMVQAVIEHYGRLDILVNNAALQPNKFVDQYTAEEFRKLWEINIGGYFHTTRECLPYLKQSPKPRIVDISSIHGKRPTSFDSGYAMTKGAIRMFTRELAMEMYQFDGRANTIDLGGCKIEFKTGNFGMQSYRSSETFNPAIKRGNYMVVPEDVGQMVWYLVNDTGDGINGAGIRIDRGLALA